MDLKKLRWKKMFSNTQACFKEIDLSQVKPNLFKVIYFNV